ncbi:MAG: ABC transporter ATP-binding protein [Phycisphaerae bacterium]|nr:ABC transporter ATP-binding protein [Phycisphaerae bacterium]MBM93000.1 ABC transporter ATP-binding protein [Phycisphaerae bacterium]HCT45927.1 ABC transporter ATP-binding protein [Phycisphaerales bacterium]
MEAVIDVRGVEKMYKGRVHALRGVDLKVGSGEIFGLLGPNGAGKSTLVKVLLTVIRATKCEGSLLGAKVGDKSVLSQVGYLPEHHNFPKYLTSRQLLRHFGAMAGVDRSVRNSKAEELLELVGMKDWSDSKLGSYSKGMRQRVGIAQALMNDPKLVILDEPTDGVDPIGRKDIREILTRLKDEGRTVFLNSHLLSELEMVCDRVAIMVHGLMRQQGTIEELTDGQSGYAIRATTAIGSDVRSTVQAKLQGVDAIETKDPTELVFATSDAEVVQPVIDTLRSQGVSIKAFGFRRPSLEDLFVKAVQEHPGGATPGAQRNKKGARS